MWQFLTDVLLVVDYWFLATTYPKSDHAAPPLAAVLCVAIAFALYVAWDVTSLWRRKDDRYHDWLLKFDEPKRRRVTYVFLGLSLVPLIVVAVIDPHGAAPSIAVFAILAVIVVAYRFVKDLFYLVDEEPTGAENGGPEAPADA